MDRLTNQEILYINALDSIAKVSAKNCFIDGDDIVFLVKEEDVGAAIGRNGQTIKKVRNQLKKNIEIIPLTSDSMSFIKKSFIKVKIEDIQEVIVKEKKYLNVKVDSENRSQIFRNMKKFKRVKEILKKIYGVENIKII